MVKTGRRESLEIVARLFMPVLSSLTRPQETTCRELRAPRVTFSGELDRCNGVLHPSTRLSQRAVPDRVSRSGKRRRAGAPSCSHEGGGDINVSTLRQFWWSWTIEYENIRPHPRIAWQSKPPNGEWDFPHPELTIEASLYAPDEVSPSGYYYLVTVRNCEPDTDDWAHETGVITVSESPTD